MNKFKWIIFTSLALPAGNSGLIASDFDDVGEEAIIVTALKKDSKISETPLDIKIVNNEDIKNSGLSTLVDLNKIISSINITNGGGTNTSLFLRGVGNTTNNNYLDPAIVPTYDGVIQGRSTGAFSAVLFDLERIEILMGPQGTLYGRNATGGVINVVPRKPILNDTSSSVEMSFGNFRAASGQAHINYPISSSSALRISGSIQERDGFNRDGTDDLDRWSIRAQYLVKPSSEFSIRLGSDFTAVGGIGAGPTYLGHFSGANFTFTPAKFDSYEGLNTAAANAYRSSSVRPSPAFYNLNSMNRNPSLNYKYWGINSEIKINKNFHEITILPAYRESTGESYFYGPALNTAYNNEKNNQKSIEIRLNGNLSYTDYILGILYINEKLISSNQFNQEAVLPIQNYIAKNNSLAFYSNINFNISDKSKLILGARYTHDKKFMNGLINNFAVFCGGFPPVPPPRASAIGCNNPGGLPHWPDLVSAEATFDWLIKNNWISASSNLQPKPQTFALLNGVGIIQKSHQPVDVSGSYNRITWKAGVEHKLFDTTLIYASIEDGYRAGGFQLVEGDTSYDPEFIRSYTVGMKSSLLDSRISMGLDAFIWKYKDQQIGYFTVDFNSGILVNKTSNAGSSTIKGIDLYISSKIFDNNKFNFGLSYLDSYYNSLNFITAPPRNNINCPKSNFVDGNGRNAVVSGQLVLNFDCSGKPLLFSPKWTFNFKIDQSIHLGALDLTISGRTSWRSSQYGALDYLEFQRIPDYWTTDLAFTFKKRNGNFALTAFLHNLENKRKIARPLSSPLGFATVIYSAPKLYGISLASTF